MFIRSNSSHFMISLRNENQLLTRLFSALEIENCQEYDDSLRKCVNCKDNFILVQSRDYSPEHCTPVIDNCATQIGNDYETCAACTSGYILEGNQCTQKNVYALVLEIVLPIAILIIMIIIGIYTYYRWRTYKVINRTDIKLKHIDEDDDKFFRK